jgi:hypothetical protein
MHCSDLVFQPNDSHGSATQKKPMLDKKYLNGNACWSTNNTVLGWDVDAIKGTIKLKLSDFQFYAKLGW